MKLYSNKSGVLSVRARTPFSIVLALLVSMFATGETWSETRTWQEGTLRSLLPNAAGDSSMRYAYYLPDGYDPANEYPMILYLHGAGLQGTDFRHIRDRSMNDIIALTDSSYPAVLVAPQLPSGGFWGPENVLDRTDELLDLVFSEVSVDANRLYATGISMGGFGTMNYLHHYNVNNPELLQFAAAAPTAGAFINDDAAEVLQQSPIWLSHARDDMQVPSRWSRETFNVLAGRDRSAPFVPNVNGGGAGGPMAEVGNVRYTEYPGSRHNTSAEFHGSAELYDWMFSQALSVPEPSTMTGALVLMIFLLSRRVD